MIGGLLLLALFSTIAFAWFKLKHRRLEKQRRGLAKRLIDVKETKNWQYEKLPTDQQRIYMSKMIGLVRTRE